MITKSNEKIDFKYDLRIYLELLKKYKFMVFALLFLVLIMEAIHVGDRYLFKLLIDNGTAFTAGSITRQAFIAIALIIGGVFLGTLSLKVFSKWANIHLLNRMDAKLIFDLKRKFFNHLITLSHGFHVSHKTGSLISRLSRGGRAMERMTDSVVFSFAPLIFQTIIVSFSLIFFDLTSAVVIFITIFVFITYN